MKKYLGIIIGIIAMHIQAAEFKVPASAKGFFKTDEQRAYFMHLFEQEDSMFPLKKYNTATEVARCTVGRFFEVYPAGVKLASYSNIACIEQNKAIVGGAQPKS